MIDQGKTRRQIIMKLKQLGLIFKAPTKKSNASAANKRLWRPQHDDQLRELYEKFRLEENTLDRIMDTFSLFKSKNAVVKRLLELGLIADRAEIVKRKRGTGAKKKGHGSDSDDSDSRSEDDENDGNYDIWDRETQRFGKSKTMSAKKGSMKSVQKLDINSIKRIVSEIEETHKEALEWLLEALSDALEDIEDNQVADTDDAGTGIPIVPILETQIQAIENDVFKRLMSAICLQSPDETNQYWRIPSSYSSDEVKKRISLLRGEDVPEEIDTISINNPNNSDSDDAENMFNAWRAKTSTNLVYHESDHEDRFGQLKETNVAKPKRETKQKRQKVMSDYEESDPINNDLALSTQEIHSRLNELDTSDTEISSPNKSKEPKRKSIRTIESDSDDNNEENVDQSRRIESGGEVSVHLSRYERMMDDDSNEMPARKGKKRDRSEDSLGNADDKSRTSDDKNDDSDDGIRKIHKKAKNKRIVLSDDESD